MRKDNSLFSVGAALFLCGIFYGHAWAQATDVWTNVTPITLNSGDWGSTNIGVDPERPSDLYANLIPYGILKSTDYGQTWSNPINTGTNGTKLTKNGNFTIASGGVGNPPVLYCGQIHDYPGFFRSTDGGVNWVFCNNPLPLAQPYQDIYAPDVDPYDPRHIILVRHEADGIFESKDGGDTWLNVNYDPGMHQSGGSGDIFFINTGDPVTTAKTYIWIAQGTNGSIGTWRTSNGGTTWIQVETNERPHGGEQLFQPGNGIVYMAGTYSTNGTGIFRSTDYGVTWSHVGPSVAENFVFGTPNHLYAMWGWACEPCNVSPAFEVAPASGLTGWTSVTTPAGMIGGGASQIAVTNDGTHFIFVASMFNAGIWRYVESSSITSNSTPDRHAATRHVTTGASSAIRLTNNVIFIGSIDSRLFDVRGQQIGVGRVGRQALVIDAK